VAEEKVDLVEVDVEVAAALKHMNSAIENSENFKLCSSGKENDRELNQSIRLKPDGETCREG
jgi:hypothetical protein